MGTRIGRRAKVDWRALWQVVLLGLVLVVWVGSLRAELAARQQRPVLVTGEEYTMVPGHDALRVMCLGYATFCADLIWLRALQYRGRSGEQRLAPFLADAILYLDPDFEAAYRWAALALIFSGGITQEGVTAAAGYYERAMERFPDDAQYPYALGLAWAMWYPVSSREERAVVRAKGIKYLQVAMQKRNAPPGIPLLISGLLSYDDADTKLAFLEQALLSEGDEKVRRVLEGRLRTMAHTDRLAAFERLRLQRHLWLEQNYPYLPPGLAFLLGEAD